MSIRKKTVFGLLITFLLTLAIPLTSQLVEKGRQFLTRASVTPANIVIDTQKTVGPTRSDWRAFAQGGEESTPYTLTPILPEISQLQPKYIRIDHLYDFYEVVSRSSDGSLTFNFDSLDVLVRDILSTGALPFFSLSYMPPVIARDGGVTSVPVQWEDWKTLVQKTIEHYSGKDGFNLNSVYYEVWNEPDLFGRFSAGEGEKDYLMLYLYAARGAKEAQNTNQFYFGGPAITGAYPDWIDKFVSYCVRSNLPCDFISWHFYGKDVNKLTTDIEAVDKVLANYKDRSFQKIISEYSLNSENDPAYDNLAGASYTLASIKAIGGKVNYAFNFSLKDGKSPEGKALWGRWGLVTHEAFGKQTKPRYEALMMLNKLTGEELTLRGSGSFVDGFAAKDGETIKVLLYNFDLSGGHYEKFPLTFTNLPKGNYQLTSYSLVSKTPVIDKQEVSGGSFAKDIILTANDVAFLELTRTASLFTYTQGRGDDPGNQSLELIANGDQPVYSLPANEGNVEGNLSFWFKPYWSGSDENLNYTLFNIEGAGGQAFSAKVQKVGFTNSLTFVFSIAETEQAAVSLPIRDWPVNSWHNLSFAWGNGKLSMTVDGKTAEANLGIVLLPQDKLQFGVSNGAIDDLVFTRSGIVILEKNFDGKID